MSFSHRSLGLLAVFLWFFNFSIFFRFWFFINFSFSSSPFFFLEYSFPLSMCVETQKEGFNAFPCFLICEYNDKNSIYRLDESYNMEKSVGAMLTSENHSWGIMTHLWFTISKGRLSDPVGEFDDRGSKTWPNRTLFWCKQAKLLFF